MAFWIFLSRLEKEWKILSFDCVLLLKITFSSVQMIGDYVDFMVQTKAKCALCSLFAFDEWKHLLFLPALTGTIVRHTDFKLKL